MRVLHVSNYLPHSHHWWGGAEAACLNVIDLLQDDEKMACAALTTRPQEVHARSFRLFSVDTIDGRLRSPRFHLQRHFWLQKDPLVERQVARVLDEYRPDLVHFHNFHVLTFSALKPVKRRRIPSVASIYDYWIFCPGNMLLDQDNKICRRGHGLHCLDRCLRVQLPRRRDRCWNLPIMFRPAYFSRQVARFDRLITLSANSRGILTENGVARQNIDVVPLPFKPSPPSPHPPSSRPTVLITGWVQARKGQDVVVRAFKEVAAAVPGARLKIVGHLCEPAFEKRLRELAAELGIADRVELTGKLPQEEFERAFAGAHVVVIAEQWQNMSPVILLESMAAKKAIVCGAVGGLPEFITHEREGLLATYDAPGSYAAAIIRALKDPALREAMGRRAAQKVSAHCDRGRARARLMESYEHAIQAAG